MKILKDDKVVLNSNNEKEIVNFVNDLTNKVNLNLILGNTHEDIDPLCESIEGAIDRLELYGYTTES